MAYIVLSDDDNDVDDDDDDDEEEVSCFYYFNGIIFISLFVQNITKLFSRMILKTRGVSAHIFKFATSASY